MVSKIDTISKRSKLKMKGHSHPVWERISKGKAIGYVKLASGGMWRARLVNGKTTIEKVVNGKTIIKEKVSYVYTDLGAPELEEGDGHLSHGDAVDAAGKWFAQVEGTNALYTLGECIDDYIEKVELNNTHEAAEHTRMRLKKHVDASMRKKLVNKLTAKDLDKWRNSMVPKGADDNEAKREAKRKAKDSSNRTLSMLKAALNYAQKMREVSNPYWREVKPYSGVKRGKKKTVDLLTERQVEALLNATSGGFYNLCKTAAITGARYGELCKANKSDFDPVERKLHLRTLKGGRGEERTRDAQLSDEAVEFLKSITKDKLPNAPLLTKDNGERWKKSEQFRPWHKARQATLKNEDPLDRLPERIVRGVKKKPCFYDLRHYHISYSLMKGIAINVVAENCGTSIKMIEETYGKTTDEYRREAYNRLGGMTGNA